MKAELNLPLKLALVATGQKQKHIAKKLRIKQPILSMIVHGHREPTIKQRKALADFLQRDINELFPEHAA